MNFARTFKKFSMVDIAYAKMPIGAKQIKSIFSNQYFLEDTDFPTDFMHRSWTVIRGRPYPVREYSKDAKMHFFSIIKSNSYDYILVRYIENAYCLFKLPINNKKTILVDFDDLFSDSLYETLFYQTKSIYRNVMRNLNKRNLILYEKKCLNLNISLFCSEKDMIRIAADRTKAFVVPNIFSNETFKSYDFKNGFENEKILLFVGMLAYEPNVMGLKWFVESIYREFKRQHPDAKLFVVGRLGKSSGEVVKKICCMAKDIELYSDVPDVKKFYKRSMVVVVPLLKGGGTRIKILEAALANRPILSTPVGSEGLDLSDGKELLNFTNSKEFLKCFKKICVKEKYEKLVKNAKKTVLKKYSEENFENSLKLAIQEVDRLRTGDKKSQFTNKVIQ
jgi:glycosyltransferase involved in cell wall biosynthesis